METIVKDAFNPEQFVPFVPESVVLKRANMNQILIGIAAVVVLLIVVVMIQKRYEEQERNRRINFEVN